MRNYDFHVMTQSCDHWLDFSDYTDASDDVIRAVGNDILATMAIAAGCCWECAVRYADRIDCDGATYLRELSNIEMEPCNHIDQE